MEGRVPFQPVKRIHSTSLKRWNIYLSTIRSPSVSSHASSDVRLALEIYGVVSCHSLVNPPIEREEGRSRWLVGKEEGFTKLKVTEIIIIFFLYGETFGIEPKSKPVRLWWAFHKEIVYLFYILFL